MKRVSFLMVAIVLANDSFAQTNIFPASGNVGIGTTSPGATLEVRPPVLSTGDVNRNVVLFTELYNNGSNGQNLTLTSLTNSGNYSGWNFSSDWSSRLSFGVFSGSYSASPNEYLSIVNGGNVGIGTITPAHKLDIVGDGINLENTTYTNQHGIIFKNGVRFISDFNYGNNGTVTTEGNNTFIGINAGNFTMGSTATSAFQASYNTGIGYKVLYSNTTGNSNTAIGFEALVSNTSGYFNTAIGFETLVSNTTGSENTSAGYEVLEYNISGLANTATGYAALYKNVTGNDNTDYGSEALSQNFTGSSNTAAGYAALDGNTIGSNNTAIGCIDLEHNRTGNDNLAVGYEALYADTSGSYNTADGYESLQLNSSGFNNTASGYASLPDNTTGGDNTAYSSESLYYTTTGNDNSAIGLAALDGNTTGSYNTANGYEAGLYTNSSTANSGSSTSVFIGASARSLTSSDNNEIVIGSGAIGAGSNSVVLGNASITKTLLQGNVLIGKTSQTNTSYKLDVNGNIRANQVTINATGADYVFDPNYRLPSIDSLSNYIKTHHHLPGIPSAEQMQKEGMNIGDDQTILLKKIEELTLYQIEANNKINELENKNNQLQNELDAYKQELISIEKEERKLKNKSK